MKKYNVAIIGLGVGEKVLKTLKNNKKLNSIKIFDFNKNKLNRLKKKYSVHAYSKEKDIYKDKSINIIYIATYDNYHYAQCKKALAANKHIFVEKPAFLYENHASTFRKLIEKKPGIAFMSNLILRKSPRFIYLKNKIKSGLLGKIYYVEGDYNYGRLKKITHGWRSKIPFYSVTLGGGLHIFDLIIWLLGIKIEEVTSYANKISTENTRFKYPDLVTTIFKSDKKVVGKVTSNFGCVFPHFHKLSVYGTKKTFENSIDIGNFYIKRNFNKKIKIKIPYLIKDKSKLFDEMIDCIENKIKRINKKKEIFNALKVCYAVDKSIKSNKKIKIRHL